MLNQWRLAAAAGMLFVTLSLIPAHAAPGDILLNAQCTFRPVTDSAQASPYGP